MNTYVISYKIQGCDEVITHNVDADSIQDAMAFITQPYEELGHHVKIIDIHKDNTLVEGKVYYRYEDCEHPYKVCFLDELGVELTKGFKSLFNCRKFVQRVQHSKNCTLKIYPTACAS